MDMQEGFFDSIIEAHGLPVFGNHSESRLFMRMFVNFRLLFWPTVYFTDSTINNNETLRYLMFDSGDADRKHPLLPRDYGRLLTKGVIGVVVRDDVPRENFSLELLKRQSGNAHSSLPSGRYAGLIGDAVGSDTKFETFRIDDVARLFTAKIKKYLEDVAGDYYGLETSCLAQKLRDRVENKDRLSLNEMLEHISCHGASSEVCAQFKEGFVKCYNNNIPEILGMNHQFRHDTAADGGQSSPGEEEMVKVEEKIECGDMFDPLSIAYLSSDFILETLAMPERINYVEAANKKINGEAISDEDLHKRLKEYAEKLGMLFAGYPDRLAIQAYRSIKPESKRHIVFKIYDNFYVKNALSLILSAVPFGSYAQSVFDQFIIPNIDSSKNQAQRTLEEAHAFIDFMNGRSIITKRPNFHFENADAEAVSRELLGL